MPNVNLNVRLPNQIFTEVIAPTYDNTANVLIPGLKGEKGDSTTINDLTEPDFIFSGLNGIKTLIINEILAVETYLSNKWAI